MAEQSVASAQVSSAMTKKGYLLTEVKSTTLIQFDASTLLQSWGYASARSYQAGLDFLGSKLDLQYIASFGDMAGNDSRLRTMLFKSEQQDNWVMLAIDRNSGKINGYAIVDGTNYDISPIPNGDRDEHLMVKIKPFSSGRPSGSDVTPSKLGTRTKFLSCEKPDRVSVEKPLTILFGYTPATERRAVDRADGDIGIPVLVALSLGGPLDSALDAAGVRVNVQSIDAVKVPYVEPKADGVAILDDALEALTNGQSSEMTAFRERRKELQADIGILLVDIDNPFDCGKANLMAGPTDAFAVVNWRCVGGGRMAVEHEVGHVLGLHHDDDTTAVPAYAKAFMRASPNDEKPFTTLMGKPENCRGKVDCYRTIKYSNPWDTNNLAGATPVPIGVKGQSDNACLLRQTVPRAVEFGEQLAPRTKKN